MTDQASVDLVHVELERDVYDYLRGRSTFEDTVSSVLRRELNIGIETPRSAQTVAAEQPLHTADTTPPSPPARPARRSAAKGKRTRAAAGTLLPESEYHRPLLEILAEHGGSAPKATVVEELGRRLGGRLTEADTSALKSGGIRWESRAQFARLRLAERGFIEKDAPRGVWAITPEGAKALEENTI